MQTPRHLLAFLAFLLSHCDATESTVNALFNNTADSKIRPEIVVSAIFLLLAGTFMCFFGRRYFHHVMALLGFYFASGVAYFIIQKPEVTFNLQADLSDFDAQAQFRREQLIFTVTVLACGVATMLVLWVLLRIKTVKRYFMPVGSFGMGLLGGFFISTYVMAFLPQSNSQSTNNNMIRYVIILAVSLTEALLTAWHPTQFFMIIFATATAGAYSIFFAVDTFTGVGFTDRTEFNLTPPTSTSNTTTSFNTTQSGFAPDFESQQQTSQSIYFLLAAMGVTCVAGILVQYFGTAAKLRNRKDSESAGGSVDAGMEHVVQVGSQIIRI